MRFTQVSQAVRFLKILAVTESNQNRQRVNRIRCAGQFLRSSCPGLSRLRGRSPFGEAKAPGIHVDPRARQNVDGRDKPGHDELREREVGGILLRHSGAPRSGEPGIQRLRREIPTLPARPSALE